MTFPDYQTATNAAYQVLAGAGTFSLSTDVFAIAEELPKCRLRTYGQVSVVYGLDLENMMNKSDEGFTIIHDDKRIILYNETLPLERIRFTLAHEIGHAVLNHQEENNAAFEKEANCFARNLLCPVPVADWYQVYTAADYCSLFNISDSMAHVTVDHRNSDRYYLDKKLSEQVSDRLQYYVLGFDNMDQSFTRPT